MDMFRIITIVFLTFFVVSFAIMLFTFFKTRKTSKELNSSVKRDMKKNPFSMIMITILFAIITSVIFGTTNSVTHTNDRINQISEEGNLYHGSIEATRFIPDTSGKQKAKIDVEKLYLDEEANNLNEVVNFLYTGDEHTSLSPTMTQTEIELMVMEDFLIPSYEYNVINPDTTSGNLLHIFYLLKKSEMDISFKYQPIHLGKINGFGGVDESGFNNNTSVKIIRDENKVSYDVNGTTMFPTSQTKTYETNIISHEKNPSIEIIDNQASVGNQFYKEWNYQDDQYNELTLNIQTKLYKFNVVDINQTPQNIVPPAMQKKAQFGEITHDMTTTLLASNARFDEITMGNIIPELDSADIAIFFNDVEKAGYEFNSEEYNNLIMENILKLESEISPYIKEVPELSPWSVESSKTEVLQDYELIYPWNMEIFYDANASINFAISQQDTVIYISKVIIPLFSILILLIILLFLRRRIETNQPYNMTLKSLGYSSKQIALSYLIIPIAILTIGWLFGVILGQSLIQLFWMNKAQQKLSFQLVLYNNFLGSFTFLFGIIIFVSVISFIFITRLLKKNIVEVMSGSTVGKPNVFVRVNSRLMHNSSFSSSYRRSNVLRQMTKSLFIFVAIASTTIIFLFGATTANFAEVATTSTGDNFNFDYVHYGDKSVSEATPAEVEEYKEYDFGARSIKVHVNYKDPTGVKTEGWYLVNGNENIKYNSGNLTSDGTDEEKNFGIGRLWYELQQDIVKYMETTSLYQKKITIKIGDIVRVITSAKETAPEDSQLSLSQHYAANKALTSGTLYTLMSVVAFQSTGTMEIEAGTITQEEFDKLWNQEFYIGKGTGLEPTYNGVSMATLNEKLMDVVVNTIINILPSFVAELESKGYLLSEGIGTIPVKDIIFSLISALGDSGILINEQYISPELGKASIGMGRPYYTNGDPIKVDMAPLEIPNPEDFEKWFTLQSISGESIVTNHMDYSAVNSIPAYVPYADAEISGLKEGDYFDYVVSEDLLQADYFAANPDGKVRFQVVGIYSSYFPLGYPLYVGATNVTTDIGDTLASRALKTNQSHSPTTPGLEDQYNSTITKKWNDMPAYGIWHSEDFANEPNTGEWTLLDGIIPSDPAEASGTQTFTTLESSFAMPIPFSIVPTVVDVLYKDFDATIQLFVIISFIMSAIVILIITKEIIDSTKSEVSTIKAMGYGKYRASSMVAESQIISMIISGIVSVPLALWLISLLENVLLTNLGLVTSFTANLAILMSFVGVLAILLIVVYLFIVFVLKNTKPLLSAQE